MDHLAQIGKRSTLIFLTMLGAAAPVALATRRFLDTALAVLAVAIPLCLALLKKQTRYRPYLSLVNLAALFAAMGLMVLAMGSVLDSTVATFANPMAAVVLTFALILPFFAAIAAQDDGADTHSGLLCFVGFPLGIGALVWVSYRLSRHLYAAWRRMHPSGLPAT